MPPWQHCWALNVAQRGNRICQRGVMLPLLPASSSMEPLEPRSRCIHLPTGATLALFHPATHAVICPHHSSTNIYSGAMPAKARGGPCRLAKPQAATQRSACARSNTPPCTDSPSLVAASAVLCGHPVNTWSAGVRPPCRYTCPHCPGQSCTPASSPRGWWATPGEGQVGKGMRRE